LLSIIPRPSIFLCRQMEKAEKTARYICVNCGYVYDWAVGDAMNAIPPGVAFEDLPEAWVCPMCYAGKDAFDPLD
jgi:rubredoxin